jgi:coproporphyrinogen III oxidase-like Fe-S oxidoreductase
MNIKWNNLQIFKLINFQIKTMSGIYIHIPFWQACHYCDFFFDFHEKKGGNGALAKEIIKANEIDGENVETNLFFWGGTPSVLTSVEIDF